MKASEIARLMDAAYENMQPWSEAEIRAHLESPLSVLFWNEGGCLLGRIVADEAELLAIATAPELHGQGFGTSLMDQFERAARDKGAGTMFLEVASHNTKAFGFYQTRGFTQVGYRPKYYALRDGSRDDAILLSKRLS